MASSAGLRVMATQWRGELAHNEAWRLSNGVIRVVVTKIGGHIASISDDGPPDSAALASGASPLWELNPLWQPNWPTKDPRKIPFDGVTSRSTGWVKSRQYGGGSEACLLANIVGHNLCIDRFGPPRMEKTLTESGKVKWIQENRPTHGEAGVRAWDLVEMGQDFVTFGVTLPAAHLAVTRKFALVDNRIQLDTRVLPVFEVEREIEWCEHVTIGDPFLDGATFDVDVDGAWHYPERLPESRFTEVPPLAAVPPAEAIAFPGMDRRGVGDIVTTRVCTPRFSVSNLGRTLTYTWDKEVFPWLCLWTENRSRTGNPWLGEARARGMEFSTKPFPEALAPERAEHFEGTSAMCTVPPSGLETTVHIEWD
mmetsp:Transcript_11068/g.33098  ORF Transcript_11068/g.33098 Transcript_11068/m.33098 type:complete len:367 (+) Transcript_11068:27-1127(+)